MTTTFPHREDFNGLSRSYKITRADVALIADVEPATVQGWTQDKKLGFPAAIRNEHSQKVLHYLGEVADWLCETGRIECPSTEGMLNQAGAAEHIGVAVGTVKQWRKRQIFPAPDRVIDRTPYWLVATLDSWEGRPRRGGNNRAPREFRDPGEPSSDQARELQKAGA